MSTPAAAAQTPPRLSVVVPAFNEEKLLAGTLAAIADALERAGYRAEEVELCVADNASTDATARIAAEAGARVVFEPERQIARARNTGAGAATAPWLLFVDADTHPSAALVARARVLMESGRVCGGGAIIDAGSAGPLLRLAIGSWNTVSSVGGLACGAFLFCRTDAFRELGGFNQALYAAEELDLSWRLSRWGRAHGLDFRIIRDAPLTTSLRKLDLYSPGELTRMVVRGLLNPRRALRDRRFLDHWYDGRR